MNRTTIKTLALVITAVAVVIFAGCRKCYDCGFVYAEFKCNSTSDTIRVYGINYTVDDTIAKYTGLGYICDTLQISLMPEPENGHICDQQMVKTYLENGDRCYATNN